MRNPSLSSKTIQNADKYVTVLKNQYYLSSTATGQFSKAELTQINQMIDQSNKNIVNQHLQINPTTKIAAPEDELFAAYNSNYTTKNFWWGTRYYFTSNAAVRKMRNQLSAIASTFNIAGVIADLTTNGAASAVAGAANTYFSLMSSSLNYYNNKHPHNQIYMDVNYSAGFSFHILA